MKDFLTCEVCCELYKAPKMLPCQHNYCLECLQQLVNDRSLECPECGLNVTVTEGISNMKSNFFLNLVKLFQDIYLQGQSCSFCSPQTALPAKHRCLDCNGFMCQACFHGHQCSHLIAGHTRESFCQDHQQELLQFFCDTCSTAICRDCRWLGHFYHRVVLMAGTGEETE